MKIALCQMENKGSVQENLEGSLRAVREAASQHADLILFPEVQLTEFFPQYPGKDVSRYRVRIDSEIVKAFCEVAREHQIMVVPNLYLEEHGKAYDASLLIRKDGTIAGVQKMVHVAQADKFFEQDYYTPADDGFKVFEIRIKIDHDGETYRMCLGFTDRRRKDYVRISIFPSEMYAGFQKV